MLKWMMVFIGTLLLTSCLSLEIKAKDKPLRLNMEGLASGYASYSGIRPWNGTLVDLGLLRNTRQDNELVSVEIWPLLDVGVGLVGMRAKVLPFEAGLGTLAYQPRPHDYVDHDDDADEDEKGCNAD